MFTKIRSFWKQGNDTSSRAIVWFGRRFPRLARFAGLIRTRRKPIWRILFLVMHLIGFACSLKAVMQTRTEQGAVAWAISLNAIPLVAVPAWFVFGDSKLEGFVTARQTGLAETRPLAEVFLKNLKSAEAPAEFDESEEMLATFETLASMPVMKGNHADLLVDGKNTFRSIFEAIEQAEDYILIEFYMVRNDGVGGQLKERLLEKASEGVDVYVLLDNYGSLSLSEAWFSDLRESGINVSYFMDIRGEANRFQLNFRNHRKIVIVDGKVGFVGGHNVGDEYVGLHPELTPWRDSHMRLTGPIVKALQVTFIEDWHWATGKIIEDLDWEVNQQQTGSMEAICVATGPADPMETCAMFFLTAIQEAKERIWIASPYFVPDDKMVTALQLAALRGVEVRVLMPGKSDSILVYLSSFSYLKELTEAGVEMYRFEDGFLHQKVVLVDDDVSIIGSANFDNRSFRLNFEISGVIHDVDFATQVEEMLKQDFSNSREVSAEDYTEKPLHFRLRTRIARMLAPIQ